jgi:hypothetical protein
MGLSKQGQCPVFETTSFFQQSVSDEEIIKEKRKQHLKRIVARFLHPSTRTQPPPPAMQPEAAGW